MRRILSGASVESRSEFEAGKGSLEKDSNPRSRSSDIQEDRWKQAELERPATEVETGRAAMVGR